MAVQVIDYENTAATLLPLIASSFVMQAMGRTLWTAYQNYEQLRTEGRFDTLPELHALSSGLKAVVTETAADGMEACRRTCGGHGYSLLSGLPSLFASYVQNCTWEGDNNVLLLQVRP
jgi:acyl-CoA oxidase